VSRFWCRDTLFCLELKKVPAHKIVSRWHNRDTIVKMHLEGSLGFQGKLCHDYSKSCHDFRHSFAYLSWN